MFSMPSFSTICIVRFMFSWMIGFLRKKCVYARSEFTLSCDSPSTLLMNKYCTCAGSAKPSQNSV